MLPEVLASWAAAHGGAQPLVVDVGAGMYPRRGQKCDGPSQPGRPVCASLQRLIHSDPTEFVEDDSDSLQLLGGFRGRADVVAFEPRPDKAEQLRVSAAARPSTRRYVQHYRVHAAGVSRTDGWLGLAGCSSGETNWALVEDASIGLRDDNCTVRNSVPVRTLDSFARDAGVLPPLGGAGRSGGAPNGGGASRGGDASGLRAPPALRELLYVKVDVEGGEFAVLDGMHSLLEAKRPLILSVEYAMGWHRALYHDWAHGYPSRVYADAVRAGAPTLRALQRNFSAWGYDTYLLHGRPVKGERKRVDVTLCARLERRL